MLLLNPTTMVGLLSYGGAGAACVVAARRWQGRRERRVARVAAACFLLLVAEILLGLRHRVGRWIHVVVFAGADDNRHVTQGTLIAVAACVALVAAAWIVRRTPAGRARRLALVTCVAVATMAVEAVSLHQVDSVVYARIAGGVLIGWVWLAIGVAAMATALRGR